jgi:hypothetical protein
MLRSGPALDPDAAAYIAAVEAADGQALEPGVVTAINEFVVGCKTDGIWDAIKASCIMAGARTLAGALVPLKGAAPTNNNFVSGDYNRKTGLKGDGSTKYLDSNRDNSADPQNNHHMAIYATTPNVGNRWYMGTGVSDNGSTQMFTGSAGLPGYRPRLNFVVSSPTALSEPGLIGMGRNNGANFQDRNAGITSTITAASQPPVAGDVFVYLSNGSSSAHSNARLAFYSIGEHLNLALLDARVTALIAAYGAAI